MPLEGFVIITGEMNTLEMRYSQITHITHSIPRKLQMDIITQLLRVKAVRPVKSNEAERSFGCLKLIKTYIQNLMTNEKVR